MIAKSTTLFKVCFVLIHSALVLDIIAFFTVQWLNNQDYNWSRGLWQICLPDGQGQTTCHSAGDHTVLIATMLPNSTDREVPGWMKAVQTSEGFGLICAVICAMMSCALLFCVFKPRLQRVAIFVCAFAGIFIDIGVIIFMWMYSFDVSSFGYSVWVAVAASICSYAAGVLLQIDLTQIIGEEATVLRGQSTKGGILVHLCDEPSSPSSTGVPETPTDRMPRPSSIVFVPLSDIDRKLQDRHSFHASLPPDEPPPPYSTTDRKKKSHAKINK